MEGGGIHYPGTIAVAVNLAGTTGPAPPTTGTTELRDRVGLHTGRPPSALADVGRQEDSVAPWLALLPTTRPSCSSTSGLRQSRATAPG